MLVFRVTSRPSTSSLILGPTLTFLQSCCDCSHSLKVFESQFFTTIFIKLCQITLLINSLNADELLYCSIPVGYICLVSQLIRYCFLVLYGSIDSDIYFGFPDRNRAWNQFIFCLNGTDLACFSKKMNA